MGIAVSVENYMPLLMAIPFLALIYWGYYRYFKGQQRHKVFMVLRMMAVIMIVLSLCGVQLIRHAKEVATIFVADLSNSTLVHQEEMADFITEAINVKGDKDAIGIVAFGHNSQVESTVNEMPVFNGFESFVNRHFTNIQQAIIQGNAMFPSNMKKRMVLLTDGRENIGDVARQINGMAHSDVAIDFFAMEEKSLAEVQVNEVIVPKQGEKNQIIEIKVTLQSNVNQKGSVYLYRNGVFKEEKSIEMETGENHYVFTDVITEGGLVPYKVEVVSEKDTYTENNRLSSYIMIQDIPHIMLIEDDELQGENMMTILEDYAQVDRVKAGEVPLASSALLQYDAFILADVSKSDLDDRFIESLDDVIKHQGKGLLAIGGDSSYGLGGYKDTLLEEMLPVKMDVKSKEEKPNLGLVLVIDKSGSMTGGQYGVSKMDLAKEAALRSVGILEEKDQLGVLAFDGAYKWVVETKVMEKGKMEDKIATIAAGGGTSILPALNEAVDNLQEKEVALKHIILLTDGQAERNGYEGTLAVMEAEGITLSTVAVGKGADRQLLYYLAKGGGGRYYATDVFTDIPSIFTKEAYMAGKKYLNNVNFYPEVYSSSPILSGIESLPELQGYVATSKKETARTILVGPEEDPILATWQYGLGRTMAFTADMQGLWSESWLGWSSNPNFWINSMSWLIQVNLNNDYSIDSTYEEGMGKIRITSVEQSETLVEAMKGTIISPDGEEESITIEAVAPGVYEGTFLPDGEGVYMAHIPLSDEEVLATGVTVGYSPEFDMVGDERTTPEKLAKLSDGRLLGDAKDVFKGDVPDVKGSRDLSQLFLILGLLIFMFEIVLRKTNLSFEWLETLDESIKELRNKVPSLEIEGGKAVGKGGAYRTGKNSKKDSRKLSSDGINGTGADGNKGTGSNDGHIDKGKAASKKKKQRVTADTSHIDALMLQKSKRKR